MDCVGPVFSCLDQQFAEVFKQGELRTAFVNQDRILRAKHVGTKTFYRKLPRRSRQKCPTL